MHYKQEFIKPTIGYTIPTGIGQILQAMEKYQPTLKKQQIKVSMTWENTTQRKCHRAGKVNRILNKMRWQRI